MTQVQSRNLVHFKNLNGLFKDPFSLSVQNSQASSYWKNVDHQSNHLNSLNDPKVPKQTDPASMYKLRIQALFTLGEKDQHKKDNE